MRSLENIDVFAEDLAATLPATVPRLAPRHTSTTMRRQHKPQPLALSTPLTQRTQQEQEFRGGRQLTRSTAVTVPPSVPPSVTPLGSDREYDGGDSSYSTSPLGSEANAKMRRRLRTIPFVPRMPAYLQATSGRRAAEAPPPSPTPRYGTLSFRERIAANASPKPLASLAQSEQPEGSLEKFLQDHIPTMEAMEISHYANEKTTGDGIKARAGCALLELSSSDEWGTTTDTDPIRSRHRHRVTDAGVDYDDTMVGGSGNGRFCNYGLQQCSRCGLFISRPETHACMRKGVFPT